MPLNVLILGGTGFIGRSVCEALARQGHRMTVPSRTPWRHQDLAMLPGLTLLPMDIHQASLAPLVRGHDAVINLVAILHGRAAAFEKCHVTLLSRLVRDMHTAGVRRLLHVSALGVPEGEPDASPSQYVRSKARGEALLWRMAEGAAGLALTVLRPSVVFGERDRLLNTFARLQRCAPCLPLACARAQFQPVWVGDVAQALAQCLVQTSTVGRCFEGVGPQVWTLADLVRWAGRYAGVSRPILPLPDWLGVVQAGLLSCWPGEPLMTRDNLRAMRTPNVATGRHPTLDALGIRVSSLEAVVPVYLGPGLSSLDRYRQHIRR